jgi:hypothetical protein
MSSILFKQELLASSWQDAIHAGLRREHDRKDWHPEVQAEIERILFLGANEPVYRSWDTRPLGSKLPKGAVPMGFITKTGIGTVIVSDGTAIPNAVASAAISGTLNASTSSEVLVPAPRFVFTSIPETVTNDASAWVFFNKEIPTGLIALAELVAIDAPEGTYTFKSRTASSSNTGIFAQDNITR